MGKINETLRRRTNQFSETRAKNFCANSNSIFLYFSFVRHIGDHCKWTASNVVTITGGEMWYNRVSLSEVQCTIAFENSIARPTESWLTSYEKYTRHIYPPYFGWYNKQLNFRAIDGNQRGGRRCLNYVGIYPIKFWKISPLLTVLIPFLLKKK